MGLLKTLLVSFFAVAAAKAPTKFGAEISEECGLACSGMSCDFYSPLTCVRALRGI